MILYDPSRPAGTLFIGGGSQWACLSSAATAQSKPVEEPLISSSVRIARLPVSPYQRTSRGSDKTSLIQELSPTQWGNASEIWIGPCRAPIPRVYMMHSANEIADRAGNNPRIDRPDRSIGTTHTWIDQINVKVVLDQCIRRWIAIIDWSNLLPRLISVNSGYTLFSNITSYDRAYLHYPFHPSYLILSWILSKSCLHLILSNR